MADSILVLGASGFIGRNLTRSLAERGIPVIAVSRSGDVPHHALIEQVIGDLREPEQLDLLLQRSRAVVHLATTSTPGTSAARPLHEVETNLHLTAALLQALHEHPQVDLLYMSSGGSLYADTTTQPSSESARLQPRSYHGATKLASETFIAAWCSQSGGKATILRPSNVYGPGQPERKGFGVIPAAFGTMLRGETLHVWGDGSAQRDYVYIDDLVELCALVLTNPMPAGVRTFNACSGTSVSLNELFGIMESVAGQPLQRSYEPGRVVDASCIAMDPTLAAQAYGWQHGTSLEAGIRQTWEHFRRATH
ncbi:NAD-dependent epimerase/dehydratase family protein [Rhodanobacter ginsenosidimutans]|uniref:NAD-dependent epimerase/dehydratase family protein n=1 Tax=Rhodanobacter ginsenosidimutans TaxID=490571 RepID=A0ABW0JYA0_9GAMM